MRTPVFRHGLPVPSLNCIGAGRAGAVLCKLLADHCEIGQIINQNAESSQRAIDFIGAGEVACADNNDYSHLKTADIWMLCCPDDQIETVAKNVLRSAPLLPGTLLFHCSGCLSSKVFDTMINSSVNVASVHPIHSFANAESSMAGFAGTHCAIEGDDAAVLRLTELFTAIGARVMPIDIENKTLYHLATVTACNHLVSLLHMSQQMLAATGIEEPQRKLALQKLIQQTVDNFLHTGAKNSLTGPISRGDVTTVANHLRVLERAPIAWQETYTGLGRTATDIAQQQAEATSEKLLAIAELLGNAAIHRNTPE